MKFSILIGIFVFIKSATFKECYWNSCCPFKYFSSKTPYNSVRGDIRDSVLKLDGCEALSIWSLVRHGKRNPGVDFGRHMKKVVTLRDNIINNYELGKSPLCAQDVENLRNWQIDSNLFEKIHGLTDEGYLEMVGIASRLREAFSELLERLDEGTYRFRSAFGHWMEDGVSGFIKGLTNETLTIEKSNATYDILAPYEACPKYRSEIKRNPLTYSEVIRYETTSEYKAMKHAVEQRVSNDIKLKVSKITALYDLCRYVWSGILDKPSPWCALFSQSDLEVLEYVGDLRHYYRNGYGAPMNPKFGRILMSDLYKSFLESKNGRGKKLTAYFSHATMMDMVVSALELFYDEHPLRGDYRDPNRKWKSSKISAFGVNLIAVLNRCTTDKTTKHQVVFYLNEDLLTEICNGGICTWQEFEDKFKAFVDTNIDFCFNHSVPSEGSLDKIL